MNFDKFNHHLFKIGDFLSLEAVEIRLNRRRRVSEVLLGQRHALFKLQPTGEKSVNDAGRNLQSLSEQTTHLGDAISKLGDIVFACRFRINIHNALQRMTQRAEQAVSG